MSRVEFELTDAELAEIREAGKPTMLLYGSGGFPLTSSPQENANRAWQRLAKKRGFDWYTVRPIPGKSECFFTAELLPTKALAEFRKEAK